MRILKDPCLIDIGLSPSAKVRAEGEHREFNKNHRDTEFTEKDYAFLWKKLRFQSESGKCLFYDCSFLQICRLQFELTLIKKARMLYIRALLLELLISKSIGEM